MRTWRHGTFGPLCLGLVLGACSVETTTAEVTLTIDGTRHDYTTARAQHDQQETGGPYSVYLKRDTADDEKPYLCLRTYSGNPVARFWLRYRQPGATGDLEKFVCFVPGTLRSGQQTLTWTEPDGAARPREETGDADCRVTVTPEGQALRVTFDAVLVREHAGRGGKDPAGGGAAGGVAPGDRVAVKGHALIQRR